MNSIQLYTFALLAVLCVKFGAPIPHESTINQIMDWLILVYLGGSLAWACLMRFHEWRNKKKTVDTEANNGIK